jgi:TrmH family RNA methyltransferase
MPTPLGAHSPRLDAVRELRTKRGRRDQGRFAVEGTTLLGEAVASGRVPEAVFATESALAGLPSTGDAPVFVVPDRAMARLSELQTPPGIVAVFPLTLTSLEALLQGGEPAVLLAGVADPGNAGTLLRSAEIFGIERAIFGRDGVEPFNPKVVRATMGAIFRTAIALAEPHELLAATRRHGYEVVAATSEGEPLPEFHFPARPLLAIGNERRGVSGWLPDWDLEVAIPQRGRGESLNAAVAGGIILYAYSQACGGTRRKA